MNFVYNTFNLKSHTHVLVILAFDDTEFSMYQLKGIWNTYNVCTTTQS